MNCKKCGVEISENQYQNFNGECSECVRQKNMRAAIDNSLKKAESRDNLGWGIFFIFVFVAFIGTAIFLSFIPSAIRLILVSVGLFWGLLAVVNIVLYIKKKKL